MNVNQAFLTKAIQGIVRQRNSLSHLMSTFLTFSITYKECQCLTVLTDTNPKYEVTVKKGFFILAILHLSNQEY